MSKEKKEVERLLIEAYKNGCDLEIDRLEKELEFLEREEWLYYNFDNKEDNNE